MIEPSSSAASLTIDQALQQAVTCHKAGEHTAAEQLYQSILAVVPGHPDANHNLGLLALQMNKPAVGLSHLKTALESNPKNGQYWLSYVEALIQSGCADSARQVLQQGCQFGLHDAVIDSLEAAFSQQQASDVSSPPQAELDTLIRAFNSGNHAELERRARAMTQCYPGYPLAWKALGVALQLTARPAEALLPIQKSIQLNPDDAEAHYNLGNALHELGRPAEAAVCYRQALTRKPDYVEAHYNLGNALRSLGCLVEAEACYRQVIARKVDYAAAYSNLGATLHDLGRLVEAEACYRQVIALKPDHAQAHNNLGNILHDLGCLAESEISCRQAIALRPDFAEAHSNLGNTLKDVGRLKEAEAAYRQAIILKPDFTEAHSNLGNILRDLGRLAESEASCRQAIALRPDFAEAHSNLGTTLRELQHLTESEVSCRQAITLKPDFAEAHSNLGNSLKDLGRLTESEASYRQAIALKPDYAELYSNLGNTLKDLGRLDESESSYRRALTLKPDYTEAYSNLLFLMNYTAVGDSASCLTEARNYGRLATSMAKTPFTTWRCPAEAERLRVGLMSGDFRNHAVGYFLENLLARFNPARVELIAYPTVNNADALTGRIRPCFSAWRPLSGLSDEAAARLIHEDGVHILLDLSGHTAHNRLSLLAWKPAPVQAHYLGYFASTGVAEVDYWIGDPILTPPATDHHFIETVWRLPRTWVSYRGAPDAPAPCWQPADDGTIWLGSFNNLGKLTPATLVLWAGVLHALPEGRLLLKTKELADINNCQRLLDELAEQGIGADRIELRDRSVTPDWQSHMGYYNRLDIALDPVGGLAGGTTTCDALWMGVPVVTLLGDRMASRMTASMLDAVGHPEWIAENEADYIDKVVTLARNRELRMGLRATQREQMARSPLCDAGGLARTLEDAFGEMMKQQRRTTPVR